MATQTTRSFPGRRVLSANSTNTVTTIPTAVSASTEPGSVAGYYRIANGSNGAEISSNAHVVFVGEGAANSEFELRVWGCSEELEWISGQESPRRSYHHFPLAILTVTLGLLPTQNSGEFYGKGFSAVSLPQGSSTFPTSGNHAGTSENAPGHLVLDLLGCQWLFFDFAVTTATSANAIVRAF